METFADVATTGTDSVQLAFHEQIAPFAEPATNDQYMSFGMTRFYSQDSLSNSTGRYRFEYKPEFPSKKNLLV